METNYILIDYENVQPKNLAILQDHAFKVMVFVGANQTRIPFDLASALQSMGDNAEYVKISSSGPNALDFHIALYLGQLTEKHPDGYFHVISKDKGFDPLIKHLRSRKVFAQRHKDLAEIPLLRASNGIPDDEKIEAIVKNFAARGPSRPRKVDTLANAINALFMKTLDEAEVKRLIEMMKKRRLIEVADCKVSYRPPISQP